MVYLTLCPRCHYVVSDPVCVRCYLKEFVIWLNEKGITAKQRMIIMRNIKRDLLHENISGQMCIICEKDATSICGYCFFFNVAYILRKLNLEEEIIENFKQHFNYDIQRTSRLR